MQRDRAALKLFFETGDVPTESEFADDIDSSPNIVDDFGSNPANIRQAIINITSVQVLALNVTPILLLAAPGAGLVNIINTIVVRIIFATTAYATNVNLNYGYAGGTTPSHSSAQALQAPSDMTLQAARSVPFGIPTQVLPANTIYEASVPTGNPTTGDSPIRIFLSYYQVTA